MQLVLSAERKKDTWYTAGRRTHKLIYFPSFFSSDLIATSWIFREKGKHSGFFMFVFIFISLSLFLLFRPRSNGNPKMFSRKKSEREGSRLFCSRRVHTIKRLSCWRAACCYSSYIHHINCPKRPLKNQPALQVADRQAASKQGRTY